MEITLEYSSTRKEVWQWYWRLWRKKYWYYHLLVWAYIFYLFYKNPFLNIFEKCIYGFFSGIITILLFISFPQLMFKPQVRRLTVSENGIYTTIGKNSGSIGWDQIVGIEDQNDTIIITRKKSGNA